MNRSQHPSSPIQLPLTGGQKPFPGPLTRVRVPLKPPCSAFSLQRALRALVLPSAAAFALMLGGGPIGTAAGTADAVYASEGEVVRTARSGRSSRGSVHRGGHRGHHRGRSYVRFGFGGPRHFGYYNYGYGYGYPWWGWGSPTIVIGREGFDGYDHGALDLDVSPEKAEVFVDGQRVGVADNYDGWPRYLWLKEGEHRLVFVKEGYETVVRDYEIEAGVILRIDAEMIRGVSTPATEHFAQAAPSRRERAEVRRERAARPAPSQEAPREGDNSWRWRDRDARTGGEAGESEAPDVERRSSASSEDGWRNRRGSGAASQSGDRGSNDYRSEPARLTFDIEPEDAALYLNGRHLGTVADLDGALLIDPGEHVLEVLRPGFESERIEFEVERGEEIEVEADLDRD